MFLQEEEERIKREEQEKREHEEYLKMKEMFSVDEEGEGDEEADLNVSPIFIIYNKGVMNLSFTQLKCAFFFKTRFTYSLVIQRYWLICTHAV